MPDRDGPRADWVSLSRWQPEPRGWGPVMACLRRRHREADSPPARAPEQGSGRVKGHGAVHAACGKSNKTPVNPRSPEVCVVWTSAGAVRRGCSRGQRHP